MTTFDQAWSDLRRPLVSVVKIDVEGFEKEVFLGAPQFLAKSIPVIILECSRTNLVGLGRTLGDLMQIAEHLSYQNISLPSERHISSPAILEYEMLATEDFLRCPRS